MGKIASVLFDLDGTLIDTEATAALAIEKCFSQWGHRVHPDDSRFVTGRKWEAAFDHLVERYRLPLPRHEAEKIILATYRAELEAELKVVPGSVSCVRALATEFRLGLVSGSHRNEILWALTKLGIREHFEVIFGAEDYPQSKPAPDGYLLALEHLGLRSDSVIVFEDSTAGITSAKAAGIRVVAISSTNHFSQDVKSAHETIPDLQGVDPAWIRAFETRVPGP